jgi:hypothetical protein
MMKCLAPLLFNVPYEHVHSLHKLYLPSLVHFRWEAGRRDAGLLPLRKFLPHCMVDNVVRVLRMSS